MTPWIDFIFYGTFNFLEHPNVQCTVQLEVCLLWTYNTITIRYSYLGRKLFAGLRINCCGMCVLYLITARTQIPLCNGTYQGCCKCLS